MKKTLALILSLLLCAALTAPALAAPSLIAPALIAPADVPHVEVSRQTLKVDDEIQKCEKYNIDGSNYFRLRDLAFLLRATGSKFSVGWDAAQNTVSIETGGSYDMNGRELLLGKDASATAQRTAQTILIDGKEAADLNVYNIGGSNYFRLRDLGDALGFDVDYDADTDTAIVKSRAAEFLESKSTETGTYEDYEYDEDGNETVLSGSYTNTSEYTYTEDGKPLTQTYISERDGEVTDTTEVTFTYDADGRRTSQTVSYNGTTVITTAYDAKENPVKVTSEYEDEDAVDSVSTYTYNDRGYIASATYEAGDYSYTESYVYDGANNLLSKKTVASDGDEWSTDYTYDAAGNCLTEKYAGLLDYASETVKTYNAAGQVLTETTSNVYGPDSSEETEVLYKYDEAGNLVVKENHEVSTWSGETTEMTSRTMYTYDPATGNTLKEETEYSDGSVETITFTYDKNGNVKKHSYTRTGESAGAWTDTYSYDKNGNVSKVVEKMDEGTFTYTFTYDEFGNLTKRESSAGSSTVTEYIRIKR